jgi:hypothetical protein
MSGEKIKKPKTVGQINEELNEAWEELKIRTSRGESKTVLDAWRKTISRLTLELDIAKKRK